MMDTSNLNIEPRLEPKKLGVPLNPEQRHIYIKTLKSNFTLHRQVVTNTETGEVSGSYTRGNNGDYNIKFTAYGSNLVLKADGDETINSRKLFAVSLSPEGRLVRREVGMVYANDKSIESGESLYKKKLRAGLPLTQSEKRLVPKIALRNKGFIFA